MKKTKKQKNPMTSLMQLLKKTDFGLLANAVDDRVEDYAQWCQQYEEEDGYPTGFGDRLSQAVEVLNRLEEIQAQFINIGYPSTSDEGYFSVIRWHEDDIKQALSNKGYLINRQNVKKVLESRAGRTLQDRSVEEGWLILEDCLDDVEGLQIRKQRKS